MPSGDCHVTSCRCHRLERPLIVLLLVFALLLSDLVALAPVSAWKCVYSNNSIEIESMYAVMVVKSE